MVTSQASLDETRPTYLEINLDHIAHNFDIIKKISSPSLVMPIIKANAYGHGLLRCGELYDKLGASFLGVAYLEEALKLRQSGIKTSILVLGGMFTSQIAAFINNNIDITASSVDKLRAINDQAGALGRKARVHLKIDTGLERIGQHYYTADKLLEESLKCNFCEIIGVYSHFATAESEDLTTSKLQLERFHEVLRFYEKRSLKPPMRHIGCSGSIMQFPESNLDITRPGLILYGIAPSFKLEGKLDLRPALSLKSKVVYFKVVKKGAGVSYGHTWHAPQDTRVVTVPIGYGDGYTSLLSNKSEVVIRGKRQRVIGKICMDQMMIDLGSTGEAYNSDEVILIGQQGEHKITIWDLCNLIGSQNPREFLTALNERIPRLYLS